MWSIRGKGVTPPAGQRISVLVVDDEAPVRELESRMLAQAEYDVVAVDDAEKALAIIREGKNVDLVIADVHMPQMDGAEMARRIRALRPDLKILFVTGFSDTLFNAQSTLWEDQAFLDKPFTRQGLLEAVSMLLHGTMRSAS